MNYYDFFKKLISQYDKGFETYFPRMTRNKSKSISAFFEELVAQHLIDLFGKSNKYIFNLEPLIKVDGIDAKRPDIVIHKKDCILGVIDVALDLGYCRKSNEIENKIGKFKKIIDSSRMYHKCFIEMKLKDDENYRQYKLHPKANAHLVVCSALNSGRNLMRIRNEYNEKRELPKIYILSNGVHPNDRNVNPNDKKTYPQKLDFDDLKNIVVKRPC